MRAGSPISARITCSSYKFLNNKFQMNDTISIKCQLTFINAEYKMEMEEKT